MENSLSPAFVKINYTSVYAPHSMIVPSVPLIGTIGGDTWLFDLRGAEIDVEAGGAIEDFVNVLKTQFPTSTIFNDYTLYSQPGVGDTPVPVLSNALGIAGTDAASGGTHKATQRTLTWRATDFTLFKQVWLDVNTFGEFDKVTDISGSPGLVAIDDYVTAPETWIASRGGGRPNTFLALTETLNEKLRRSYRMT
jgi:hypothetical protein